MVRIFALVKASGPRFSPAEAMRALGVTLDHTAEPGSRGSSGKTRAHGSGVLRVGPVEGAAFLSVEVAQDAVAQLAALRTFGAEDAHVHLDVEYDAQCNLEIEPAVLAVLARGGAALTVSCYPGPAAEAAIDA
jgi:hypothetical protein